MFPRIFLVQGTARPLSSDTRMTIMTRERERETEDDVEGRKSLAFEVVFGRICSDVANLRGGARPDTRSGGLGVSMDARRVLRGRGQNLDL